MQQIRLLEAEQDALEKWQDAYGDHLYLENVLMPFDFDAMYAPDQVSVIKLAYFDINPTRGWAAAGGTLRDLPVYRCPYTRRRYYWAIPYAVLVAQEQGSPFMANWREAMQRHPYLEMSLDKGWNKSGACRRDQGEPEISGVERCLLGPGYTEGTLASDGSGSITWAVARITGGDLLLLKSNLWHNK